MVSIYVIHDHKRNFNLSKKESIGTKYTHRFSYPSFKEAFVDALIRQANGKNYTIERVKKMDRNKLLNFIADTTFRNEQGKQKAMGQAELARKMG